MHMLLKILYRTLSGILLISACSCTAVNIVNYYSRNQHQLDSIASNFKTAYRQRPFSIEFTDRPFDRVSLELMTDSLTYIYEFFVGEDRMRDTLKKYGFDAPAITGLITQMRYAECAWISSLDYYAEEKRQSMIYVSLWPRVFNLPFVNKKYYILTYFPQRQYFDSQGDLLTGRRRRRIRRINTEVFKRISDTVCYSLSGRFR